MRDTGYNPTDKERTAATEYQTAPPRGLVWGEVHDENAWSLGGVAGHAGVFSTADDLAVLAQTLLDGGTYRGHRILDRKSVELIVTNFNQAFPGDAHGLGFELDQRWYMDALSGPRTAGHTGYTGTSIVIDFASRSFAILLTNRVHPSREWGSNNQARREWAHGLAASMPVDPRRGRTAWYAGGENATTATLTAPVSVPERGARLGFDLFVDTESTDVLTLETSADGGATWSAAALRGPRPRPGHADRRHDLGLPRAALDAGPRGPAGGRPHGALAPGHRPPLPRPWCAGRRGAGDLRAPGAARRRAPR